MAARTAMARSHGLWRLRGGELPLGRAGGMRLCLTGNARRICRKHAETSTLAALAWERLRLRQTIVCRAQF
jgi:hypothetical protein